jgi:uncharacterized protein YbjT (DUF2867 family)
MTTKESILLIGARGFLGSKVLNALLATYKDKYTIQVLIREGSNASALEAKPNVQVVRGDMMDLPSLKKAFSDTSIAVIINTANGYGSGNPEVDTEGAENVVNAMVDVAPHVRRYVYCSVLTCDKSQDVEHFWNKKLGEDYAKSRNLNMIALRPGAFLDQADDYLGAAIQKKVNGESGAFCISMWNKTVPIAMIYTPDLAQCFATAVDVEANDETKQISIDVGWTTPASYQHIVDIVNAKLETAMTTTKDPPTDGTPTPTPTPFTPLSCYALPYWLRMGVIYTVGYMSGFWAEIMRMFNFFDTGVYVNTVELQTKYLGAPPTPEDAIGRYVDKILADLELKKKKEVEDKANAEAAAAAAAAAPAAVTE